jgi:HIRAN domain
MRTSITKAQRQTAAASELIMLCQTMTSDGHLGDEEVMALRDWLATHRESDLPAIAFLTKTVDMILADGKVTPAERLALYEAIETVLPPDIRVSVKGARVTADRIAKNEQRIALEAERKELSRDFAVETWDFPVAGVMFEGRADVSRRYAQEGDVAYLIRDRRNRHSRHAIEVRLTNGMQVGFVPEEHAVDIAPLLDSGYRHGATIKILWRWEGGDIPIPIIVASIFRCDATRPDALRESEVPAAQKAILFPPSSPAPRGTTSNMKLLAGGVGAFVLIMVLLVAFGGTPEVPPSTSPSTLAAATKFRALLDNRREDDPERQATFRNILTSRRLRCDRITKTAMPERGSWSVTCSPSGVFAIQFNEEGSLVKAERAGKR